MRKIKSVAIGRRRAEYEQGTRSDSKVMFCKRLKIILILETIIVRWNSTNFAIVYEHHYIMLLFSTLDIDWLKYEAMQDHLSAKSCLNYA